MVKLNCHWCLGIPLWKVKLQLENSVCIRGLLRSKQLKFRPVVVSELYVAEVVDEFDVLFVEAKVSALQTPALVGAGLAFSALALNHIV